MRVIGVTDGDDSAPTVNIHGLIDDNGSCGPELFSFHPKIGSQLSRRSPGKKREGPGSMLQRDILLLTLD
jgi:hypothetical protein